MLYVAIPTGVRVADNRAKSAQVVGIRRRRTFVDGALKGSVGAGQYPLLRGSVERPNSPRAAMTSGTPSEQPQMRLSARPLCLS